MLEDFCRFADYCAEVFVVGVFGVWDVFVIFSFCIASVKFVLLLR